MEKSVTERAQSIASTLDPQLFENKLTGSNLDLDSPDYQKLKGVLTDLHKIYSNSRFVYVMGKQENSNEIFFFADSEEADSEDYSPPGDLYSTEYEDDPASYRLFAGDLASAAYIDQDRWGTWLTGLAPIKKDGKVVAVVGIDLSIREQYIPFVASQTLIPILIGLIALFMLLSIRQMEMKTLEQVRVKEKTLSLAVHEIRTPMTGILLGIESLIEDLKTAFSKGSLKADLLQIHKEAERILTYFNNLLTSTVLDSGKKLTEEVFSLEQVILDSMSHFELIEREKNLKVIYENKSKSELLIKSNKDWVKLIIDNLLSNAIKYSFEKTEIKILTNRKKEGIVLEVHNKGLGIPKDELSKIFQEYYRDQKMKGRVEGSGIGLHTTQKIVEKIGGKISVSSTAGKETVFKVVLPAPLA